MKDNQSDPQLVISSMKALIRALPLIGNQKMLIPQYSEIIMTQIFNTGNNYHTNEIMLEYVSRAFLEFAENYYDVVDVYEPYIHFWQTNITKYKYIYKDFAIFDGLANETSAEGFGVYIDKKMYIGNWVNDKRNGTGTEYLNNGNYAVGTWINNEKSVVTYYNFKGNEITKEEYEKE